jgi:acetyl-CoA carboxylase biotin carboxyl carrier protein
VTDRHADPVVAAVDLLAPAFERSGLDELELTVGDLHVRLARSSAVPPTAAQEGPVAPQVPVVPAADLLTPYGEPESGRHFVGAPLTGVWYDAPSPGARRYVSEGDEVTAGQVVGLIEAMKLFNEIKSDVSGTVARVLVESGTLVKRKQPLLEIDPR